MKKGQIYVFDIDRPLTPARRKAVEKQIELNAEDASEPVSYGWDEEDEGHLVINVGPVQLDVFFQEGGVEVHVSAPLWARLLIKDEQENKLKALVGTILDKAKFIGPAKASRPKKAASA